MTARVTLKNLVDKSNVILPGGQTLGPGDQVEIAVDLSALGHDAAAINNLITQKRLAIVTQGNDEVGYSKKVVNGASRPYSFRPMLAADTSTYGASAGALGLLLGTSGAVGDYLEQLNVSVFYASATRLMLQDGSGYSYTAAGSGTAFTTATAINFGMGSTALTAVQAAALVGQFLVCSCTVGAYSGVLMARRITGATATAGVAPNLYTTLTVDSLTVATLTTGGAGTAATAMDTAVGHSFIVPLIEILPPSLPAVDSRVISVRAQSKNGGWRIWTDSGLYVVATGSFT